MVVGMREKWERGTGMRTREIRETETWAQRRRKQVDRKAK